MVNDYYLVMMSKYSIRYISIGYSEIYLYNQSEIEKVQEEYLSSIWASSWFVIGYEGCLGDPLIIINTEVDSPVFIAAHGKGAWKLNQISDSVTCFFEILSIIVKHSSGRETPNEFELNPLGDNEIEHILHCIKSSNLNTDLSFWGDFIDNSLS